MPWLERVNVKAFGDKLDGCAASLSSGYIVWQGLTSQGYNTKGAVRKAKNPVHPVFLFLDKVLAASRLGGEGWGGVG